MSKQKIKYNKNLLDKFCNDEGIKLLKEYSDNELNIEAIIEAKCLTTDCKEHVSKSFKYFLKNGCFCKTCQKNISVQRRKNTNIEKYGHESLMQNTEIFEKQQRACFKKKEYKFPSSRIELVQGYEPHALNILIKQYNEDDIITNNTEIEEYTKEIKYIFEGKEHKYYTDIYIKKTHTFIEVKSTYTFDKEKEKNMLKKDACINAGINFEFWIMNRKGEIIKQISYDKNETKL